MKITKKKLINLLDFVNFKNIKNFYFEPEKRKIITSDEKQFLLEEEKKDISFFSQHFRDLEEMQKEKNLIFAPFYQKIKQLVWLKIKQHFVQHELFFSFEETQKIEENLQVISYENNDFYLLLNCYAQTEKEVLFFDVKMTSSNFLKKLLFFNSETEKNEPIFIKNQKKIFVARHQQEKMPNSYFGTIKNAFYNLKDSVKNFYNILYHKFFIEHSDLFLKKEKRYFLILLNSDFTLTKSQQNTSIDNNNYPLDIISLVDVTFFLDIIIDLFQKKIVTIFAFLQENNTEKITNIYQANIPTKNSIFTLLGHQYGFRDKTKQLHTVTELIEKKILHIKDIPDNWLNRISNQIQKQVIVSKKRFVDKEKINLALKSLKYPFYYLDFETFSSPLPRFFGETPYSQSVFQFSLHIEKKAFDCNLIKDHYHFVNDDFNKDCRLAIIQKLLKLINLDKSGTIIVYNAHFEKSRFKEWQVIFPQFKEQLQKIIDNTFDLLFLLKGNQAFFKKLGFKKSTILFYDEKQQGSYSIKKILPLLSSTKTNYQHLVISNGLSAMITFAKLNNLNNAEKNKQINALIEYCRQDTWAMVEILHNLQKMIKE